MEGESSISHDVNSYVTESIPRATPYLSIVQDVCSGFGRVKAQKQQLSLLRELCVYATAQHASMEIFVPLLQLARQCGDSDGDRKIFRTALYILSEMLQNDPQGEVAEGARRDLWALLSQQLTQSSPARAYASWRAAGVLNEKLDVKDQLASLAAEAFRGFQLPEKPTKWAKRSTKRDYEDQQIIAAAKLSAFRRTGAVNVQLIQSLGVAATSAVPDIARHALAILANSAQAAPDAVAQVLQLQKPPADDTINIADTLCCIYAIRAYEAIAMAENAIVAESVADAAYMKIIRLAGDQRLRIQMETIRALTEHRHAWARKTASETSHQGLDVVQLLVDMLTTAVKTCQGVSLKVSCRTCALLGRFVVNRPRTVATPISDLDWFSSPTAMTPTPVDSSPTKLRKLAGALTDVLSHTATPYLLSEVLKGLIWVVPEAPSWNDEMAEVWKWLQKKLREAQQSLPVELLSSVIRHLLGRMRETPVYSAPLVELTLSIGQVYFCREPSTALCGLVVQTWARVASYGNSIARPLLTAVLSAIDILSNPPVDASDAVGFSKLFAESSVASVDDLRRYAFWFLGEQSQLWGGGFLPTDTVLGVYKYQAPDQPMARAANLLTTVILHLQNGVWFEDYQTRVVCAAALCKLAVRTEDLAAKAYLYHILHEVQMSAYCTAADLATSVVPDKPQLLDDNVEAMFGALCTSIGFGAHFGLEPILMPTMAALDEMFQRMDQAPAFPMQAGGRGGMSTLVGSPLSQSIPPDIQRLLHVSQQDGV